jgi:hypothetical protein
VGGGPLRRRHAERRSDVGKPSNSLGLWAVTKPWRAWRAGGGDGKRSQARKQLWPLLVLAAAEAVVGVGTRLA